MNESMKKERMDGWMNEVRKEGIKDRGGTGDELHQCKYGTAIMPQGLGPHKNLDARSARLLGPVRTALLKNSSPNRSSICYLESRMDMYVNLNIMSCICLYCAYMH